LNERVDRRLGRETWLRNEKSDEVEKEDRYRMLIKWRGDGHKEAD
jgi:hypothetical protein